MAAEADNRSALDKPTLEAYVRHLLIWGPQIEVEISDPQPSDLDGFSIVNVRGSAGQAFQAASFYVSADGKNILRATVYDIDQNPFYKDFERIDTSASPAMGTAGAPVRLVLFTDFQCPFCRQEAEMLRDNLIKTYPDQVRLYFKDYPLSAIHPWAKDAAIAGRCVYRQSEDAFWEFHDAMFAAQKEITVSNLPAKIGELTGALSGIDALQLNRCIENKETEKEIDASIAEARALDLNSTPTLFINGRKITQQLPWANLKQVIDFELDYQETAQNAGDIDCCSVKLPTPLGQ